ncbi:MAG: ABC transporter ATP-binding protein [Candidatus Aenigmarchaeota archaeon]|nr:ABC transporter ATP-binding protein [Candidatus Aenigmarchaeota archaeon]
MRKKKIVVECKNVTKIYNLGKDNETVGVKNINLKIYNGEKIVILGPSGSGKSTLLHLIGLIDKPTKGKITINGKDVSKMSDDEMAMIRREKIGFVFQFFQLIPSLNAIENVLLPMVLAGRRDESRALELLKMVGLEKRIKHFPNQLSGGEQQRVAIARALANDPEIIIADEPTGNLDSKTGYQIVKILDSLNKKFGKTLIIVTHNRELTDIARRVVHIRDGKIIKEVRK